MLMDATREQLTQAEAKLRALRDDKARATRLADSAKAALEGLPQSVDDRDAFEVAKAAVEAVKRIEQQIEEVTDEQSGLLRQLGDAEAGGSALLPQVDGWAMAAAELDLDSKLRVDVGASSLLRASLSPVPLPPTRVDSIVGLTGPARSNATPTDSRYLYPVLAQQPFGSSPGDLAATDYVVTFSTAQLSGLTGIERPPDATTEKAVLTPTVTLATVSAKQFAVVLGAIPSKLFDTQGALRGLLGVEMARQVDLSIDKHVVSAIQTASPPSGSVGTTLVARVRNAIAAMRDLGGNPTYLALTPADAAALDLTQDASGSYVFRVDSENSSSVIWSLRVRTVPSITAPTLIDPAALGVLYLGSGSVVVDPFSSLATNQIRARAELESRCHLRNVVQGAYRIV